MRSTNVANITGDGAVRPTKLQGERKQLLEARGTTLIINDLSGRYDSEEIEILGHGGSSLVGAEALTRLIAAAPELLAALKEIIKTLSWKATDSTVTRKDQDNLIREIAQEAIAKAEGK